ncbi:MAG: cupin domain-containing protein [Pseudomonadota bacterium]
MRRSHLAVVGGTAFAAAAATVTALAIRRLRAARIRAGLCQSAEELPYKDAFPGVSRAVLRGDPNEGAFAAFARFAPGTRLPLHAHSNDHTMVVLAGGLVYGTAQGEVRVGPRSHLFIPACTAHTIVADPEEGCLMFEESPGKFDMETVEKT